MLIEIPAMSAMSRKDMFTVVVPTFQHDVRDSVRDALVGPREVTACHHSATTWRASVFVVMYSPFEVVFLGLVLPRAMPLRICRGKPGMVGVASGT